MNRCVDMEDPSSSFASVTAYLSAISKTHSRLKQRMAASWTPSEEMNEVRSRSGAEMRRKLKWYDLIAMGMGGMLGAGIFVTTGTAAKSFAGPSIVLAYIVAGISALLSAFCYTEFAVEMPVAGGAFSYLRITFGEFAAFFTGANLLMEYVLSNAAVARSFTAYFSAIFGVAAWRIEVTAIHSKYNMLDFPAVALLIIITIFLCYSTKDSSIFNMVMTVAHVLFILFIIVAGFVKGDVKNFTTPGHPSSEGGFFPYGVRGVLNGAAIVYFSYIGYDAVSTLAEEVEEPVKKNIPIGVSGSVAIVSVLYCLMAASMSMLVPYDMIDADASYPMAFRKVGWDWAAKIVSVGASLGIFTSLLVAMLGQARYLCVIGRSNVIPYWFAKVNPSTGTPINATVFLGVVTSAISLFTDLEILLNMISIGTLFVFYMVANALIFRRHVVRKISSPWPTLVFLALFSGSAIGFVTFWNLNRNDLWWGLVFFGVLCVLLTMIFWWKVPQAHKPADWGAPLMPWLAAVSIFLNVFLLGSVDWQSYRRFGLWSIVVVIFYVVYSVHASFDAESNRSRLLLAGKAGDLELQDHHHQQQAVKSKLQLVHGEQQQVVLQVCPGDQS
ncbi:cationic amino acid transporter 6, chloroplastic [Selaginella moellendorffii]|nr:cationic amino acid transporter 6, chloroplastic [Selaginella moellendorffii]|eukprot:XP_002973649.2 cationic amino acid transporter 6, chloroplastic [Selaginella moellendorffii]